MRKADLPRVAPFIDAKPDEKWWDADDEVAQHPELVTVTIYEANYAWTDQREAAARAGIPFYGTHGEGGEYGRYAFAALNGEMREAPLTHEGDLFMALGNDLQPLEDIESLRAYIAKLRGVKMLFGLRIALRQRAKPTPLPA